MECPGDLVYDGADNHCTSPENDPACLSSTIKSSLATTAYVASTTVTSVRGKFDEFFYFN